MKKLLIPLLLLFSYSGFAQQNNALTIDSLKKVNQSLQTIVKGNSNLIDSLKKEANKNTVVFDVKDWEKKKKSFEKGIDWIAILFQFLSLLIPIGIFIYAGKQALIQIKKQSEYSLTQTRINNISQARINWVEELRKNISEYIGLVALVNYYMGEVVILNNSNKNNEAEELYNKQINQLCTLRKFSSEIILRLNSAETKHKQLEDLIVEYRKKCAESYKTVTDKNIFLEISDKILSTSKDILKEAWEQAKNEGKSKKNKENEIQENNN